MAKLIGLSGIQSCRKALHAPSLTLSFLCEPSTALGGLLLPLGARHLHTVPFNCSSPGFRFLGLRPRMMALSDSSAGGPADALVCIRLKVRLVLAPPAVSVTSFKAVTLDCGVSAAGRACRRGDPSGIDVCRLLNVWFPVCRSVGCIACTLSRPCPTLALARVKCVIPVCPARRTPGPRPPARWTDRATATATARLEAALYYAYSCAQFQLFGLSGQ